MESLLVQEEALQSQTGITAENGHNIWSDRWIALKVLQLCPEAVFLVLLMESLLVEEEVLSRQTRIKAQKGHNFSSDRWSRSKFYASFRRPFSL